MKPNDLPANPGRGVDPVARAALAECRAILGAPKKLSDHELSALRVARAALLDLRVALRLYEGLRAGLVGAYLPAVAVKGGGLALRLADRAETNHKAALALERAAERRAA